MPWTSSRMQGMLEPGGHAGGFRRPQVRQGPSALLVRPPQLTHSLGGYGHLARHHAAAYTDKAKQEADERRSANPGKGKGGGRGKGKGKGKKGGRGRGAQQLNMQDEPTEQNEIEAGKDAAQRFLDALMVADYDDDDNDKGNTVAALEFGRGPIAPTPKFHGMKTFLEGFACKLMMISLISALMTGLAILAIGFRAPMHIVPNDRLEGITGRHRLLGKLHAMDQTADEASARHKKKYKEARLALRLPGSCNCRGHVWLANARVEARLFSTQARPATPLTRGCWPACSESRRRRASSRT